MDRLKATELGTSRGTERSLGRCLCSDDSLLGLVFPGVRVTILLSFRSRSQLVLVLPSQAQTSNPHPRALVLAGLGDIALASTLPRRPIPVHPTVPAPPPHSPPALPSGFSLLLSLTPSVAPYLVKALLYFLSPLLLLLSGSPPQSRIPGASTSTTLVDAGQPRAARSLWPHCPLLIRHHPRVAP